ncbi:MAG: carbohydrate porin [Bacteroidetes bacterium]|nr:MAG: carbohydrate porin [Bacteroidota bacterium]
MRRIVSLLCALLLILFATDCCAQGTPLLKDSDWNFHFQITGIIQAHPTFNAPYSGQNSLTPEGEKAFSVTSTIYLGRKLWKGAAIFFNPEMAGGRGIGSTLGIAGFPNGETFRIGNPEPVVYVARLFLQQQIALDKNDFEDVPGDQNQFEEKLPASRITLSLGKFGMADFFDDNEVSHDPRTDFMNWALMNNGAYDYPANTRGYTYGFIAEYIRPKWALRFGTALMPTYSNGPNLDFNYFKANSQTIEYERKYTIKTRSGNVRLLGYFNVSKAPNYDQVVEDKLSGVDTSMDVIYGKEYGGKKFGFGISADQELSRSTKIFARLGWNDGKTATWAFAEIDNTITYGIRVAGYAWKRPADNFGVAIITNGISSSHRNFLNAGGYGFMIGDSKLPNYGRENITEVFYQLYLLDHLWLSGDYQFVLHPAYNRDRGPVHVFAARVHIEF